MAHCDNCARDFSEDRCPTCGAPPEPSTGFGYWLKLIAAVLCAGLFLGSVWGAVNSMSNSGPVQVIILVLIFAALMLRYAAVSAKSPRSHRALLRKLSTYACIALAALVAIVLMNRLLDRTPAQKVYATVVFKFAGSRSTYYLDVAPSWRSGKTSESLSVGRTTFSNAHVGDAVSIELHPGLFHMPWRGNVLLRSTQQ